MPGTDPEHDPPSPTESAKRRRSHGRSQWGAVVDRADSGAEPAPSTVACPHPARVTNASRAVDSLVHERSEAEPLGLDGGAVNSVEAIRVDQRYPEVHPVSGQRARDAKSASDTTGSPTTSISAGGDAGSSRRPGRCSVPAP